MEQAKQRVANEKKSRTRRNAKQRTTISNHFEDFKAALLISMADVQQEFKIILSMVEFKNLQDKKEVLL